MKGDVGTQEQPSRQNESSKLLSRRLINSYTKRRVLGGLLDDTILLFSKLRTYVPEPN